MLVRFSYPLPIVDPEPECARLLDEPHLPGSWIVVASIIRVAFVLVRAEEILDEDLNVQTVA